MNKKKMTKKTNLMDLYSVDDEVVISRAQKGEFGETTKWSAIKDWAFPNKSELANYIREAERQNKDLRIVYLDGELTSRDHVEIIYEERVEKK